VRSSATRPTVERPAPVAGQDTEEILREFGADERMIANLESRKAIEQAA
jgi:crotonobetainyl-CoA:carnitine CoA-transferase CaiB-like acyl-CoA transferase